MTSCDKGQPAFPLPGLTSEGLPLVDHAAFQYNIWRACSPCKHDACSSVFAAAGAGLTHVPKKPRTASVQPSQMLAPQQTTAPESGTPSQPAAQSPGQLLPAGMQQQQQQQPLAGHRLIGKSEIQSDNFSSAICACTAHGALVEPQGHAVIEA